MLSPDSVSNDKKCRSLKEKHLICIKDACEVVEAGLKLVDVGDE